MIYNLLIPLASVFALTGLFVYYIYSKSAKQFLLYKFYKQGNKYFFNKLAFYLCVISIGISILLFLITIILSIVFISINFNNTIFIISIFTIFYSFCILITYLIWRFFVSSILFIIKNDQIIIEDLVISFAKIEFITNDAKRKNIIIHYINDEKDSKIISIKYNWQLKDLIIENDINNKFI